MNVLALLTIIHIARASIPEGDEVLTNIDVQLLQAALSVETKSVVAMEDNVGVNSSTLRQAQYPAPWSEKEMLWVRAELYKIFGWGFRSGYASHGQASASKALRLAFHDCFRYVDDLSGALVESSGCDGCFNYKGIYHPEFAPEGKTRVYPQPYDPIRAYDDDPEKGHGNNGLHGIAASLEVLYETDCPESTDQNSLKAGGKSRADLWAFAGIVAVEFGIEANNRVCDQKETLDIDEKTQARKPILADNGITLQDSPLIAMNDGGRPAACFGRGKLNEAKDEEDSGECDPNQTPKDNVQCPQRLMPDSNASQCKVLPTTRIQFQTGRVDCDRNEDGTDNDDWIANPARYRWNTTRPESHPDAHNNGPEIVKFMKQNFGFTSRETVAIMGGHAMGKLNKMQSHFKYTWTAREEHMFNNEYYRNIMSYKNWHVDDNVCTPVGTAYKKKPYGKFMAKMNMRTFNGGPIQWVQYKHTCPNCPSLTNLLKAPQGAWSDWKEDKKKEVLQCCDYSQQDDGTWVQAEGKIKDGTLGCKPDNNRSAESDALESDDDPWGGCERWRIIRGRESAMLSTDMGLWLHFDVNYSDGGKPYGCEGLEYFTTDWLDAAANKATHADGSKVVAWQSNIGISEISGETKYWQGCGRETHVEEEGEKSLSDMVEEYGEDEALFVTDFFKSMQKMLSNGYDTLTYAPDHWSIDQVTCSWPIKVTGGPKSPKNQVTCTDSRTGSTATSSSRVYTND